jgi:chromosome segregation ATPase
MKKIFILSMLTSFAMICSCQKQDSAVEQQLAQQKAELDAREKALDERVNALGERVNALDKKVKALAENEKATANAQTVPPDIQSQDVMRDAAQLKALMADPSQLNSARVEKDRRTQERRAQRQAGLGELQSQRQPKSKISGAALLPAPESSPTPSPAEEAASPTPSPTPQ